MFPVIEEMTIKLKRLGKQLLAIQSVELIVKNEPVSVAFIEVKQVSSYF